MAWKTAGILGGMGPEATVDLMDRIIRATPAEDDADHVRLIVDQNPQVPSRLKALFEGTGESPAPCLAGMAVKLEEWGADFLAIPCNTAHYYYDDVKAAVSIPVLNIIGITVDAVAGSLSGDGAAGLLASTAVIKTGLYDKAFSKKALKLVTPSDEIQERLLDAICAIKRGDKGDAVQSAVCAAAHDLVEQGAGALVVACTELSVVASCLADDVPVFDSAQLLAERIVKEAKGA